MLSIDIDEGSAGPGSRLGISFPTTPLSGTPTKVTFSADVNPHDQTVTVFGGSIRWLGSSTGGATGLVKMEWIGGSFGTDIMQCTTISGGTSYTSFTPSASGHNLKVEIDLVAVASEFEIRFYLDNSLIVTRKDADSGSPPWGDAANWDCEHISMAVQNSGYTGEDEGIDFDNFTITYTY